jgi:hypothetical protein
MDENKQQLRILFVWYLLAWIVAGGLLPLLPVHARNLGAGPGLVGSARIEIGVGAQPVVASASQEIIDRLIQRFARDVPASHLQGADHPHHGQVGVLGVPAGVERAPEHLGVQGIGADDETLPQILDQTYHRFGQKGHGIGLADALDALVGVEFDEHPVPPASMRRRIAHDERFEFSDLHLDLPLNDVRRCWTRPSWLSDPVGPRLPRRTDRSSRPMLSPRPAGVNHVVSTPSVKSRETLR